MIKKRIVTYIISILNSIIKPFINNFIILSTYTNIYWLYLVDEDEEEHNSEIITSLKNNIQHSDSDKLLFRLNLFPKFSEGGRRM